MESIRLAILSQWLTIFAIFWCCGETTFVRPRKCGVENFEYNRPQGSPSAPNIPEIEGLWSEPDAYNAGKSECEEQYLVPVAWHVIFNSQGRGNVSDSMLEDQIRVLNDAFSDAPFRFATRSIDRTSNDDWFNRCIHNSFRLRRALGISPATTLNIYTCEFLDQAVIGDSTFPWRAAESHLIHGVAIHFGTLPGGMMPLYNLGDNAVHEIGHYFGLFHVCEGGCFKEDDEVADTPRCSDYTYFCTNESVDTCPTQSGLDPINNYMGFIEDRCMWEFTPGQINKMERDVNFYRPTLVKNIDRPCTIDAVFRWSNGFIYFFLGSNYYRYNEDTHEIDPGYPRPISDHWRGVPSSIDGVFRYVNGMTYFFKGNQYYRFNDSSLSVDAGYPRLISDFWVGVPDDIDDVISYSNDFTYFFKGSQYYRFDPTTQEVDLGYPRPISSYWKGIPNDIEGALPWYNGGVYVFKDSQTWFFLHSDVSLGVPSSYPKSITKWWSHAPNMTGYTVFRYLNGNTYFFKGNSYWRYNEQLCQVDVGYPRSLVAWGGVPAVEDAAFVWSDGDAYFFKANLYYRYNSSRQNVQDGYPREISSFWHGVPDNVNAVFRYTNGITYFFKDSLYYRFNDTTQMVDPGYPRPIASFWRGVPDDFDTVYTSGCGHVYFFKENLFYRFNQTAEQVDSGFPKSLALWRGVLYQP